MTDTNKTPDEIVSDLVNKPRSLTTDGGTVAEISIQDAIAADEHLAKKAAVSAKPKNMGIRIGILRGPGHF